MPSGRNHIDDKNRDVNYVWIFSNGRKYPAAYPDKAAEALPAIAEDYQRKG